MTVGIGLIPHRKTSVPQPQRMVVKFELYGYEANEYTDTKKSEKDTLRIQFMQHKRQKIIDS